MPAGRLYSCTPRRVKCASYLDPAATPTGGKREININNNPRPFTAINHSAFKVLYLFFFTLRRGREGRKQQQDTDEDNSTQISFVTIASIATSYFQTLFSICIYLLDEVIVIKREDNSGDPTMSAGEQEDRELYMWRGSDDPFREWLSVTACTTGPVQKRRIKPTHCERPPVCPYYTHIRSI